MRGNNELGHGLERRLGSRSKDVDSLRILLYLFLLLIPLQ
jgi:hypothetical protein